MWHWTLTHFSFVCCVSQLLFLYFFIFHKLIWWVEEGLFTSYFSRKEISFIVSSICCPSPSFQLLPPGHFAVLINTPSSSLPSWCSIVCVCVCSTGEERETRQKWSILLVWALFSTLGRRRRPVFFPLSFSCFSFYLCQREHRLCYLMRPRRFESVCVCVIQKAGARAAGWPKRRKK